MEDNGSYYREIDKMDLSVRSYGLVYNHFK